jgi:serine/threonine protein kinase/tetratricopeptide (TPR) repeat protein
MEIPGYRVHGVLGEGGMGVVLDAVAADGQRVAIKTLRKDPTPQSQARFERERQLLAEVSHEAGFVPILAAGLSATGQPYFVMPRVGGGTLRDRMTARGAMPVEECVELVRSLADAMGRAHAQGIVHRDLKPANVLFDAAGGWPLIADLGLAKHLVADESEDRLSKSGVIMGTAGYMPPEQIRHSKSAGPQADVFALGAILHECLAGGAPFGEGSSVEVMQRVLASRREPLVESCPRAPRWLTRVLDRCLEPEPADRFADGRELCTALTRAAPAPSHLARRGAILGMALLVVVAAGAAVLSLTRDGLQPPPTPAAPSVAPDPSSPSPSEASPPPTDDQALALLDQIGRLASEGSPAWKRIAELLAEGQRASAGSSALRARFDALSRRVARELVASARKESRAGGRFSPELAARFALARELAASEREASLRALMEHVGYCMRRSRYRKALPLLAGVSGGSPLELRLRLTRARCLWWGKEDDESRRENESLAEEDPRGVVGLTAKARRLAADWHYAESNALAEEALSIDPDFVPALVILAIGESFRGKPQRAQEAALRILKREPDYSSGHRCLAFAYMKTHPAKAVASFTRAMELAAPLPRPRTLQWRGWIRFHRLKQRKEGRADLDRALSLTDPTDVKRSTELRMFRAVIAWLQGDRAQARQDWRWAYTHYKRGFQRRLNLYPPLRETAIRSGQGK